MTLVAKNISLEYPDGMTKRKVLDNITLEINARECVALTGPSGSGKSSLMYLLSTLKKPSNGAVLFNGVDISAAKNAEQIRYDNFGFIFQQHFLIPYLTVVENVCKAQKGVEIKEAAYELLNLLEIKDLADRLPHQLSGGQRQRVAIARALVKKPSIIFADEPTASLDKETAVKIYALLKQYSAESTLVITTHDISLLDSTERVIKLENAKIIGS